MLFSQILKFCRSDSEVIAKTDKDFSKRHDFKDTKFPVKS